MTTKKILLIVVSIVVVLGLIVLIFVGGIVGSIFYGISNSEAAEVSREFLRNNAKLKEDIGEIREFGKFITGNINFDSGDGTAQLSLKVVGERKTVTATLELIYRNGKPWRVIAASYKNESGQTIDLLNPYEARAFLVGQAFLPVHFSLAEIRTDKNVCPALAA
ncbi:MAG TPA: cytochrome c oxidase assembly factor Coa1 family protein [Pyrinomonadaceae bacterium]|nr:cytochrome c oxidase assembly factor Coa1 family protein [Pyrinomonadaceae bacterium]